MTASTLLKTVRVNQQTNGGRWNVLGYFFLQKPTQGRGGVGNNPATAPVPMLLDLLLPATGATLYIDNGGPGTTASGSLDRPPVATVHMAVTSLYRKTNGATYSFIKKKLKLTYFG
ncbi:MAG: hypothetical protein U5J82_03355 [Desulfobacterales bacterium]|nr:hypothetical protein [Desulfobacterales bacterium]